MGHCVTILVHQYHSTISGQNEKYLEKFWHLEIKWKNLKIEKTTFLDELGNFKHFEPYFIFWPHLTPLTPIWTPLGAPFSKDAPFSQHGMSSIPKWRVWPPKGFSKMLGNFFSPWGANWGSGGAMDPFFNRFSKYWLFLKSAGYFGSGGIIGFVQISFGDEK